ncbi:protein ALWAYS EARLY 2 isoform X3 [Gossypium hirsutum]|uniref:Protein ALWAYS EARLY 2 isoform X3 n=1 Tax=Gossypium hirsutum TaxID=3635 RepID=A0ABM2ZE20_GOSHI|nr:protein ALWAYS EARLY 2-like isoform X3 [Gossypium hirsutum]
MAPTRKYKTVNKQYSSKCEVSPDKDAGNSRKSNPKKLFDKLGSPWSKAEIERFYKAYREYGKDWKKVAAAVRNRSTEMVEAFYIMNRAYLSLPDGVASVIGLIAMMTDHYSVLGGSDAEIESNEPSEIPRKTQKRKWVKAHFGSSKEDVFLPQSIASTQGCLSLLKRIGFNGINPHAVGRRTPRVPVSYSYRRDDMENYNPPKKRVKKSEANDNDDEHVAAVTLTGALQRGSCPQFSQRPYKKAECRRSTPVQSYDRMLLQSETTKAKLPSSSSKHWMESRHGVKEPVIGTYIKDTGPTEDMEGAGTVEVRGKGKKVYRKKVKAGEFINNLSDDVGEACSGIEEGIIDRAVKGKVEMEISGAKCKLSPWSQRKKSKKIVSGDESASLDALLALANLSTSISPASIIESEVSAKFKEDRIARETDEKPSASEAASTSHRRDETKHIGPKEKVLNLITGAEDGTSRKSKVGRYSAKDDNVVSEPKQRAESTNNSKKSKSKSLSTSQLQISNPEAQIDSPFIQSFDNEDMAEEVNKSLTKGSSAQSSVQSRQRKSFRVPEDSLTKNDPKFAETDSLVSTLQVPAESKLVSLPNKHQSRRKMNLKRALLSTDINSLNYTLANQPNKDSLSQDGLKERLSFCLSSNLARRWCSFEWFYSAIDYAWFVKKEFVEYLNHVGLGHIPRLTRVEWGVIRSSLGKPRRFSERFLHEEREKLKQYRESVRQHYAQLRIGTTEGLPMDLPQPLSIGQRVSAIHPETREVNDGKVLGLEHDCFKVQFDCPELGVELVTDIDCMPLYPLENLPETLRSQNLAFDKFPVTPNESQVNGHSDFRGSGVYAPSGHLENATGSVNMLANRIKEDASHNILNAKTSVPSVFAAHQTANGLPLTVAHIQGREADIQVMSELNRALDKKEAILMELRNTNDDILDNKSGGSCLKGSEPFKRHIPTVLVQLKEANGQVSSALHNLRQHNAYPANPVSPQQKPPTKSNFLGSLTSSIDSSLDSQESDSVAGEIVEGSRLKAGSMVDAAIKAMSSTKEDEDAFMRIVEVLDSIDKPQFTPDIRMPVIKSAEPENGSISYQKHLVSRLPQNNEQVPSELITSCVASLLMIQTCTERRFPPADVAQIMDLATRSLHPWCSENLRIYREIQRCMGKIKTQILALIPT